MENSMYIELWPWEDENQLETYMCPGVVRPLERKEGKLNKQAGDA